MTAVTPKILFVVPYNPLLGSEGPQGPKNVTQPLIQLLSKNNQTTLVVITNDSGLNVNELKAKFPLIKDAHVFQPVSGIFRHLIRAICCLFLLPPALSESFSISFAVAFSGLASTHDLIHFEYFTLAPFICLGRRMLPTMIHGHDAYSLFQERCLAHAASLTEALKAWVRVRMFRNLERNWLSKASLVLTVSPVDRDYLTSLGLLNARYLPAAFQSRNQQTHLRTRPDQPKLLIIVSASYQESQAKALSIFFRHHFPSLVERLGFNPRVVLFGKSASQIKSGLNWVAAIEAVNFVTDYHNFLDEENWIAYYPQRIGAGLHTKLRDFINAAVPIIGHPEILDAFQGVNGTHYYSCTKEDQVVQAIHELMTDSATRETITRNAKELLDERFSERVIIESLVRIHSELVGQGGPHG